MHVLLTGASGFVGRHLLGHLERSGHRVTVLRRGGSANSQADYRGPELLHKMDDWPQPWPAEVDTVVHLAAANPSKGRREALSEDFLMESNIAGTAALARRSAREGVQRFVFLSSANVHAPRANGGPVTEHDPIAPQSPYARSKAQAEQALRHELETTSTRFTILRPAPVFGTGGRGTVAQLARLAATPLPLPLRGLGGRRSLMAVEDLVAAIERAAVSADAGDHTLLLAGGAARPDEIVTALRHGAGHAPRILPAPASLIAALARGLGKGAAWDNLASDFVIDSSAAERVLGWKPAHDLATRLRGALPAAAEETR